MFELIRKPIDISTGQDFKKCTYGFFPGMELAGSEPEIVVKAYDSILFQHPDTALFLTDRNNDNIKEKWIEFGKPVMIVSSMEDHDFFIASLPDIKVISIYELLLQMHVSGGCNSVDYIISDPNADKHRRAVKDSVKELAESMGVTLHDDKDGNYPYITYSIKYRDKVKSSGKDAVHILELIYGMGNSNTHMIHEHEHDHESIPKSEDSTTTNDADIDDCDGNRATCRLDCKQKDNKEPAPLPTELEKEANRQELCSVLLQLFWNGI